MEIVFASVVIAGIVGHYLYSNQRAERKSLALYQSITIGEQVDLVISRAISQGAFVVHENSDNSVRFIFKGAYLDHADCIVHADRKLVKAKNIVSLHD